MTTYQPEYRVVCQGGLIESGSSLRAVATQFATYTHAWATRNLHHSLPQWKSVRGLGEMVAHCMSRVELHSPYCTVGSERNGGEPIDNKSAPRFPSPHCYCTTSCFKRVVYMCVANGKKEAREKNNTTRQQHEPKAPQHSAASVQLHSAFARVLPLNDPNTMCVLCICFIFFTFCFCFLSAREGECEYACTRFLESTVVHTDQ